MTLIDNLVLTTFWLFCFLAIFFIFDAAKKWYPLIKIRSNLEDLNNTKKADIIIINWFLITI